MTLTEIHVGISKPKVRSAHSFVNMGRHLKSLRIQPDQVMDWDLSDLRDAMMFHSGKQLRWFNILSEARQSKYAKAKDAGFLQSGIQYANDRLLLEDGTTLVMCPWAVAGPGGCVEHCITETGRNGKMPYAKLARNWRAEWLYRDPYSHIAVLMLDLVRLQRKADNMGLTAAVRLDTTSNLQWYYILPWLPEVFPDMLFVDYDRSPKTDLHVGRGWHLAHSMHAERDGIPKMFEWIRRGVHVSAICHDKQLLLDYRNDDGLFVDADKTDTWMFGERPVIGLLKPKRPMNDHHASAYQAADVYTYWREPF